MSITQQIASAERELNIRERNYPRWVTLGKLDGLFAQNELKAMKCIVKTLQWIQSNTDAHEAAKRGGLIT